ncbi:hypothetical protein D3C84_862410 [compost metagenome]
MSIPFDTLQEAILIPELYAPAHGLDRCGPAFLLEQTAELPVFLDPSTERTGGGDDDLVGQRPKGVVFFKLGLDRPDDIAD